MRKCSDIAGIVVFAVFVAVNGAVVVDYVIVTLMFVADFICCYRCVIFVTVIVLLLLI